MRELLLILAVRVIILGVYVAPSVILEVILTPTLLSEHTSAGLTVVRAMI